MVEDMDDIILGIVLILLIGGAILYLVRAKKAGVKCVGCPHSAECAAKNKGGCNVKQE